MIKLSIVDCECEIRLMFIECKYFLLRIRIHGAEQHSLHRLIAAFRCLSFKHYLLWTNVKCKCNY